MAPSAATCRARCLDELAGETGGHNAHIATGAAVALSLAYVAGIVLVGAGLTVRRDVT